MKWRIGDRVKTSDGPGEIVAIYEYPNRSSEPIAAIPIPQLGTHLRRLSTLEPADLQTYINLTMRELEKDDAQSA